MNGNDVTYDVPALTYVVLKMAKKNASLKTKTYLRPSDVINEVSHKPMSLQRGSNIVSNTKIEAVIFVTYSKLLVGNFKSARGRIQRFQAFAAV